MSTSGDGSPGGDSAEAAPFSIDPASPVATLSPGLSRILAPNPSVMTGPGTNSYIVGDGDLAVVDPGPVDAAHLDRLIDEAGDRIRYVLVTHHHADHAPLARELAARARVPLLAFGYPGSVEPDRQLRDGDVVDLGSFALTALHTPGHAVDHLCFLLEGRSQATVPVLLSGDHVMSGSTVVIAPLEGDMTAYIESLERLLEMNIGAFSIAPGHGALIEDGPGKVRAYIDHRFEREQMVRAALQTGDATAEELVPRIYQRLAPALVRPATSSIWAHLRRLGDLGEARCEDRERIDAVWSLR